MKKIVIAIIKMYQATWPVREFFVKLFVSPDGLECRYYPTCSEYTIQAIDRFGILKGSFLGAKRILRCNPRYPGGEDPVPKK